MLELESIVLVHGYSVQNFSAYGNFPRLLAESEIDSAICAENIYLSAFDSLNDEVNCTDLVRALNLRIERLEKDGLIVNKTAFITHSTGSIIVRRWILDRLQAGKALPSHFISLAGANHGSTLAQLGETTMNQLKMYFFDRPDKTNEILKDESIVDKLKDGVFNYNSVGMKILSDLDYGSDFLLKLNKEWLNEYENLNQKCYVFSLIGDNYNAIADNDFESFFVPWQLKEIGSDSVVRISGSNLNYQIFTEDFSSKNTPTIKPTACKDVANLILNDYSHIGKDGILEKAKDKSDKAFEKIVEALKICDRNGYKALVNNWNQENNSWFNLNESNDKKSINSTLVFNITAPGKFEISDYLITITDSKGSAKNVAISNSILKHQPITNKTNKSTISFYINTELFQSSAPHKINITVLNNYSKMQYSSVTYNLANDEPVQLLYPNQCTYVELVLDEKSFHILKSTDSKVKEYTNQKNWQPLPEDNL